MAGNKPNDVTGIAFPTWDEQAQKAVVTWTAPEPDETHDAATGYLVEIQDKATPEVWTPVKTQPVGTAVTTDIVLSDVTGAGYVADDLVRFGVTAFNDAGQAGRVPQAFTYTVTNPPYYMLSLRGDLNSRREATYTASAVDDKATFGPFPVNGGSTDALRVGWYDVAAYRYEFDNGEYKRVGGSANVRVRVNVGDKSVTFLVEPVTAQLATPQIVSAVFVEVER